MTDNTATSKVEELTSSPNPSTSSPSSAESRKSASSNPKSEMSQLKRKIECADKAQLCHAMLELCKQIPEAAKLLSSLLPAPTPRVTRGRSHPSRSFTSKAPSKQLATKAARKSAPAAKEKVSGDESEEESRLVKKRKRTCEFCGEDCRIESESDGDCKPVRLLRAR